MAKSLTSFWLKSFRRASLVQQAQGKKLIKSLLLKPVRKSAAIKLVPKVKVLTPGKTRTVTSTSLRSPAHALAAPSTAAADGLAGSWGKAYCTLPATPLAPARRMLYWLYLPPGAAAADPRPLVVMLHGCKQTASEFAAITQMNQLAERKDFAVLYPQQSAATDRHRCWHWYKRATQQGGEDVQLLAAMVRQVQARHRLDANRTCVAGLSAGAGMAAIFALCHPELVAAVGLHSSPVFGTCDSVLSGFQTMQQGSGMGHRPAATTFLANHPGFPGMPVMVIHGKSDPVVRRINADQLTGQFGIINQRLLSAGEPEGLKVPGRYGGRCPRHAYTTTTYRGVRQQPVLVNCEVEQLGHAWSGGAAGFANSDPEGPNASLMLWNFFARQRRQSVVHELPTGQNALMRAVA